VAETITIDHLKKLVAKGLTIVVVHAQDWSGPCQRILESMRQVASASGFALPMDGASAYSAWRDSGDAYYSGLGQNGHIITVNADENPDIANYLSCKLVPTLYYFLDEVDGRPRAALVGAHLVEDLQRFCVESHPKKDYVVLS